jgi:PAS domain S-box-containing protein
MVQETPQWLCARLETVGKWCGVTVSLIGILVLFGWSFEVPTLKSMVPDFVAMKVNTALAFVLAGFTLLLLVPHPPRHLLTIRILSALIIIIGFLTFCEYLFNCDLGIDQLLSREPPGALATVIPGRMAPNSAVGLLIVGLSLIGLDLKTRSGMHPGPYLAIVTFIIALLALLGYLFGASSLAGPASYTKMSLPALTAFLILSVGVLCARPEAGFIAIIANPGPSGILARRLLPAVLIMPTLTGWLLLEGQRIEAYDTAFALALFVAFMITVFATLVLRNCLAVERAERERAAGQAAQEASQYTRSLIEASVDPLVTIGPEGKITDVNETTEAVTGCSRNELIGTDFSDYFTEPEKARHGYQQAFSDGVVRDYQLEMRHRNGQITPVSYNATLYHGPDGKIRGVFAAARDISRLKQAETEREQFCRFFQTSSDIMVIADPTGAFLKTNPACTDLLGYSAAELASRPFLDFVHPDDKQSTLDEMTRQLQRGFSLTFENRYLCKDGSIRWLSWSAVYDGNEGRTYATARDITLNKQQEEALKASERDFRSLAEAMPQIVWVTDPEGKNIYFNQQWVEYTGLSLEESYGDGWNKPFHPDDQAVAWDAWENATQRGGRYSLECRLRRKDGIYKWWLVRGVPLLDEKGEVLKWFGTCTDIDDVKRAEEEKLALEQHMQQTQKLESIGILAGGIAHDFNNILMAVIGNASLALSKLPAESPAVSHVQQIEKAAERAADLAKQMLAYAGKGKFLIERVDLNSMVKEMLPMLESISKNDTLQLHLSPDLPMVEGDATQLRQIIMNMVINASEAIGDQNGVITISSGSLRCDENSLKGLVQGERLGKGLYVYLEIADTGCGMSSDVLGKVFDPFFTTKFTGRGLGMAAVLGIVRSHQGAIKVYSEPDIGSIFRVLLPASGKPAETSAREPESIGQKTNGTVLLVDDEDLVLDIGSAMLQALGWTVVTAKGGKEAVEVFKSRKDIALVILDFTMPQMNGAQCLKELQQLRPDVKVMMSSGFSEQEVVQRFQGKGLAGFVQKPYKLSALSEALRKAAR